MKDYSKVTEWLLDHIPYGWRMSRMFDDLKLSMKSWWQRRTKGFADAECWSLDSSLSKWILPRLKHFRDNVHGMPSNLEALEQNEHKSLTLEEWKDILNKMIYAFEFVLTEDEILEKCYPVDFDWGFTTETKEDGRKVLVFKDDRKPDYEYYDICRKRYEEGMRLFALYFTHLWD